MPFLPLKESCCKDWKLPAPFIEPHASLGRAVEMESSKGEATMIEEGWCWLSRTAWKSSSDWSDEGNDRGERGEIGG